MYVMPEVLEQLAGLGEVDDRLAEAPAELERRRADHGHPLDEVVVGALALLPRSRELDPARGTCENAPTVGLIDISLSLRTISSCVWRWPMSLSASSD